MLSFAKELAAALDRNGCKAFLTRRSDSYLSIKDRIKRINRYTPDIAVSIPVSSRNEFALYNMPIPLPHRTVYLGEEKEWKE
ncbi:MAG: N-acetylmuramoyl-L-alanine amidase [Nitrospirae bacterium]|nr:N-acetylmuramoyl-L-alanine amidase [Nitrospirota bacterium]